MEEKTPKSKIDLRKLMQKLGMGTNAFAEACGVSTQSMAQYLRVESLTTKTIYKMATALDIDPRDMFFPTDDEGNVIEEQKEEPKTEEKAGATAKVGMIMCPHCHCGFEITGVVTPPTE